MQERRTCSQPQGEPLQRSALKKEDEAEEHGHGLGAAAACQWVATSRPASMTFDREGCTESRAPNMHACLRSEEQQLYLVVCPSSRIEHAACPKPSRPLTPLHHRTAPLIS
jgi:hypothetical protein